MLISQEQHQRPFSNSHSGNHLPFLLIYFHTTCQSASDIIIQKSRKCILPLWLLSALVLDTKEDVHDWDPTVTSLFMAHFWNIQEVCSKTRTSSITVKMSLSFLYLLWASCNRFTNRQNQTCCWRREGGARELTSIIPAAFLLWCTYCLDGRWRGF